jgi:hypothetical protein
MCIGLQKFPSDCEMIQASTFFIFRKTLLKPKPPDCFPLSGSTFQRTPCGGWRLSASVGVTLHLPAPALRVIGLTPG